MLTTMFPFLTAVAVQLEEWRETLGPFVGSFLVKANFHNKCAQDPGSAVEAFAGSALQYSCQGVASTSVEPSNVIIDCISLGLYNVFNQPIEQHKDGNETADSEVQAFQSVREVVSVFIEFLDKASQTYKGTAPFAKVLQAVAVVCDAAIKQIPITPSKLQAALDFVDEDDMARRIKESWKKALGAAIVAGAKLLLAEGELDDQCDDDFQHVLRNVHSTGVEVDPAGNSITVAADFGKVLKGRCEMVPILQDALTKLREVVGNWSASRIAKETENIEAVFLQFALNIVMYDASRMHECHQALGRARSAWARATEEGGAKISEGEWPPAGVKDVACAEDVRECEDDMAKFVANMLFFLDSGLGKVLPSIAEVRDAIANVRAECLRFQRHRQFRTSMWNETLCLSNVALEEWVPGDEGMMQMLLKASTSNTGFLAKALDLATSTTAIRECDDYEVVPMDIQVVVKPANSMTISVFHEPQSFQEFINQGVSAEAAQCVLAQFLYNKVENIVNWCLGQIFDVLTFVDAVPQDSEELKDVTDPTVVLKLVTTGKRIATLAGVLKLEDDLDLTDAGPQHYRTLCECLRIWPLVSSRSSLCTTVCPQCRRNSHGSPLPLLVRTSHRSLTC